MADTIRIVRQYEEQRVNEANRFRLAHVTKFMVGDDGPFEVVCDADTLDPAVSAQLVTEKAARIIASRQAVNG